MNRILLAFFALVTIAGGSSCNLYHALGGRWKPRQITDSTLSQVKRDSSAVIQDTALVRRDTVILVPTPAVDSQQLATLQKWLPVWNAQTPFSSFSGKARVHYEGKGENQDFTANIRIEKDRKIWISITALGLFEAMRALITPDTIIAIDRIHKEVRILPFSEANKLLPVAADFRTLQSLLIGDVLSTGLSPSAAVDTGNIISLRASQQEKMQQVSFNKADSSIATQALVSQSSSLQALYRDYDMIAGRRFAKTRNLIMVDKGETYHIDLDFSSVHLDEPVEMNFSIPDKYERK